MEQESIVRLPRGARPPYRVFVNGVEQREGADYVVEGGVLRFARDLAKEGKIGFWRWAAMFFGLFGTYRKNDSVDVSYSVGGRPRLVTGLDIEPVERPEG
jgi:curli biogenesis system outer membrane secretion channel CsgG